MMRRRWHDVAIALAIAAIAAVGAWALWWDDVRSSLGSGSNHGSAIAPATRPGIGPQT
jgi:hypothetical protein